MSATNTTTNYGLPIFIGSDKPAWLVDFNGAMNAIDAQMKINADAIAAKSPILTFDDTSDIDFTQTGNTITANLSSGVAGTVSRALVRPISAPAEHQIAAVDPSGNQEALSIGTGLKVSGSVLNAIDLDLTVRGSSDTFTGLPAGVTLQSGNISYAFNTDRTIGKIYGNFTLGGSGTGLLNFDTGIIVDAPEEEYTIGTTGMAAQGTFIANTSLVVHTNGHVYLIVYKNTSASEFVMLFPCLYFFTDFGDQ